MTEDYPIVPVADPEQAAWGSSGAASARTADRIYYTERDGYGILGLNVVETAALRRLHEQLNRELAALFDDTSAPHDGDMIFRNYSYIPRRAIRLGLGANNRQE